MQVFSHDCAPALAGRETDISLGVFTKRIGRALTTLSVENFTSPAAAYAAAALNPAGRLIVDADNFAETLIECGEFPSKLILICGPEQAPTAFDAMDSGILDVFLNDITRDSLAQILKRGSIAADSAVSGAPSLDDLGRRMATMAHEIERLVRPGSSVGQLRHVESAAGQNGVISSNSIRAVIRTRRARDSFFADNLFSDPAWDILLDLMAARLEGKEVSISSLCIAANVPPTTALRWIKTMTDEGLLERTADPTDGRRIFVALSQRAAAAMEAFLRKADAASVGLMAA